MVFLSLLRSFNLINIQGQFSLMLQLRLSDICRIGKISVYLWYKQLYSKGRKCSYWYSTCSALCMMPNPIIKVCDLGVRYRVQIVDNEGIFNVLDYSYEPRTDNWRKSLALNILWNKIFLSYWADSVNTSKKEKCYFFPYKF